MNPNTLTGALAQLTREKRVVSERSALRLARGAVQATRRWRSHQRERITRAVEWVMERTKPRKKRAS